MLTKRNAGGRTVAKSSRPTVIATAGRALGDGVLLELVQGETATKPPRLLIWDGKRVRLAQRFSREGLTYVPTQLDPTIKSAVRFPAGAMKYGSTRELFAEVSGLISRVARLRDRDVAQITFFIFATWLAECLPRAPFLWIVAPPTASTGPLLQVLGLLCRRALFVAELTLGGLRSLPMELKPTIVTEVSTTTRSLIRVLRASNRQGTYVPAGEKVLNLFCAKIVFANEPLRDPVMAGFPLEIALAPTQEHVPLMHLKEAERVAAEFQAKFLMYRLVNHDRVTAPSLDLSKFTAPMQELAHSLAASIVGDADLQSQIVPLLNSRDREIRVDRAGLLECIVLEALLAACHDAQLGILPLEDLTKSVNTILVGRGTGPQVSPESVGWNLKSLGFRSEFITGGRKGLALLDETRERIHSLAAAYSVRTLQQGLFNNQCPHCAALRLHGKERGGES